MSSLTLYCASVFIANANHHQKGKVEVVDIADSIDSLGENTSLFSKLVSKKHNIKTTITKSWRSIDWDKYQELYLSKECLEENPQLEGSDKLRFLQSPLTKVIEPGAGRTYLCFIISEDSIKRNIVTRYMESSAGNNGRIFYVDNTTTDVELVKVLDDATSRNGNIVVVNECCLTESSRKRYLYTARGYPRGQCGVVFYYIPGARLGIELPTDVEPIILSL